MAAEHLATMRARIAEAIGGRSGALSFEKSTERRFLRQTLQSWIDGRTSPSADDLEALANETNRPLEWFFGFEKPAPVILPAPETVLIPVLDVQASAGPGRVADVVKAEDQIAFPLYFLRRLLGDRANSARLESLRAHGDSMAPTITSGAFILLDRGQRELPEPPKNGSKTGRGRYRSPIFVFYQGSDLRLKRLQKINRDFVAIISDNNDDFPVEAVSLKEDGMLKIIGKVIWWDNKL